MILLQNIRRYLQQPLVRPWALIAPVLTLVICLPLLRPLRQPDPSQISDDEKARLAMVEAIVEQHSLRIDGGSFPETPGQVSPAGARYATVPPMQSVVAAPVYWILRHRGLSFKDDLVMVRYLLVLLCVTVPVALSAGMVYRLGRLFELPRPARTGLALVVALPVGLVTSAVTFGPHAPAAVLVLAAVTCISHVAVSEHPRRSFGWLFTAGVCAALACTFEASSVVVLALLPLVVMAMRWPPSGRLAGVLVYVAGLVPVFCLNGWLIYQMTGAITPLPLGSLEGPDLSVTAGRVAVIGAAGGTPAVDSADDDVVEVGPVERAWASVSVWIGRLLDSLLGRQGLLSHFPVVLIGIWGALGALRRHWASTTKVMAAIILVAVMILLLVHCVWSRGGPHAAFGPDWILVLLPVVMIWSGSWMRRPHYTQTWVVAGLACGVSLAVAIIGAVDRPPRDGYRAYSVAEAVSRWTSPDARRGARP